MPSWAVLLVFDIDLDGLRLGLFPLRHGQHQLAVFVLRLDMLGVDRTGQRKATGEGALGALHPMVVLFLHVFFELTLALQVENAVLNADFHILRVNARQICLQH